MNMSQESQSQVSRAVKIIVFALVSFVLIALVMSVFHRIWWSGSSYRNTMMDGEGVQSRNDTMPSTGLFSMGLENAMMDQGEEMMNEKASFSTEEVVTDEKVVRNGNLNLRVESAEQTVKHMRQIAMEFGGTVQSSSIFTEGSLETKSGSAIIRVSSNHFDDAMDQIKSIARVVLSETTSGRNVSAEAMDLQARLKNKQIEEQSIANILTRDTNKISDVLQVTRELSRVRGEIERLQAQIDFLNDQADQSTITVSFSEDTQIGVSGSVWRPSQEVKDALNGLLSAGRKMISFFISFFLLILPVSLLVIALFGGIAFIIVRKLLTRLRQ